MRYRQMELELPAELGLPTCGHCGELWLGPKELRRIDAALSAEYVRELNRRADAAVRSLRATIAQRDLERLLGVSAGLFSKIKGGKETSPTLAGLLMLLANDPLRIEELGQLWLAPFRSPGILETSTRVETLEAAPLMTAYEESLQALPQEAPPDLSMLRAA